MNLLSVKNLTKIGREAPLFTDVTFGLNLGEKAALIGRNGSGKSTMLKAIAGIFSADEGYIDLHGNTVSLLSIGVGFKNALTGRENIYLSGMLLGFDKEKIDEKN